jgi:hypothetical protein
MNAPQPPTPGPLERTVDAFERRLIDNLQTR